MFCRSGADNAFHQCKMCSNRKEALVCGLLWFRSFLQCQQKGKRKTCMQKKLPGRWWTKSWRRQISWTSCLIEETWGCWGIEATSWHFIKSDALWVNFVTGDGGFILVAGEHLILNLLPHWHRVVWSKKMFWNHHCYVHASSLCSQSTMICDVYIYIRISVLFSVMLGTNLQLEEVVVLQSKANMKVFFCFCWWGRWRWWQVVTQ